jgi:predicted TIM-barrel fold metal-dependent hydrolase
MFADCHVHLFNPKRFPYRDVTVYEPPAHETASVEQFLAVLDAYGFTHSLLINPSSGYGNDNECMLDAIKASKGRLKGICLLPFDVEEQEIDRLARNGVVGYRLDLMSYGSKLLQDPKLPAFLAKLRNMNWILQIQCEKNQLVEAAPLIEKMSGLRVIVDHCGRPDPAIGVSQPGFQKLLSLSKSEKVFAKLSGPFRFSRQPYPYTDTDVYAKEILKAFTPERCIWGSDWPFIRMKERTDYGPTLAHLERWVPDIKDRHKILSETPARLFGFR